MIDIFPLRVYNKGRNDLISAMREGKGAAMSERIVKTVKTVKTVKPVKTVAFTGYRPEKMPFRESLSDPLYVQFRASQRVVMRLLFERGYTRFVCGMAMGFDTWVAEDVLAMREAFPEWGLQLHCVLPFPEQAAKWRASDRARYDSILSRADKVVTVSPVYSRECYHMRNRYMADMADVVVAAYDGQSGGTKYTVEYAHGLGRRVICIHPGTGARWVYGGER